MYQHSTKTLVRLQIGNLVLVWIFGVLVCPEDTFWLSVIYTRLYKPFPEETGSILFVQSLCCMLFRFYKIIAPDKRGIHLNILSYISCKHSVASSYWNRLAEAVQMRMHHISNKKREK